MSLKSENCEYRHTEDTTGTQHLNAEHGYPALLWMYFAL